MGTPSSNDKEACDEVKRIREWINGSNKCDNPHQDTQITNWYIVKTNISVRFWFKNRIAPNHDEFVQFIFRLTAVFTKTESNDGMIQLISKQQTY